MFTGAIAASFYGTPRTTMDVDVVLHISLRESPTLIHALSEAGVSPDDRKIRAALASDYRIVTLLDTQTPYTVDVILATEPLEKRGAVINGQPTYIQAPEALILAKLRMIKATMPPERAQKDRDDVTAILRHTHVDKERVLEEASRQGTLPILEELTPQNPKGKPKRGLAAGRKP